MPNQMYRAPSTTDTAQAELVQFWHDAEMVEQRLPTASVCQPDLGELKLF